MLERGIQINSVTGSGFTALHHVRLYEMNNIIVVKHSPNGCYFSSTGDSRNAKPTLRRDSEGLAAIWSRPKYSM